MLQSKEPSGWPSAGKGGLDAGVKKVQFILQKKIIRLDFFVSFLGDAKKKKINIKLLLWE
jgi:hypothetical protein